MLIDSHFHLPHKKYQKTPEEIVKEAQAEDVVKLINIGTSIKENKRTLEMSKKFDNVFSSIGIYPHDDKKKSLQELEHHLEDLISNPEYSKKIVGIGECGFDITNYDGGRDVDAQRDVFEMQIQIAIKHNLPLIVHNRNGDEQTLNSLKKFYNEKTPVKGVIHCFDSNWQIAQQFLNLGFYISFSGLVTFPSREDLAEVAKNVPLNRFLVETDSPYLAPQGYRGEINYPKYVRIVAENISQIKEKPFEEICECSYKNTCDLFKI